MEIGNVTKAATYKSSLHQKYKSTVTFLWQYFFITFMKQTLTDVCLMKKLNINIKPKTLLKLYSKMVISI